MTFFGLNPRETINIDIRKNFGELEIRITSLTLQKTYFFLKISKFQHILGYLQKVGYKGAKQGLMDSKPFIRSSNIWGGWFYHFEANNCQISPVIGLKINV